MDLLQKIVDEEGVVCTHEEAYKDKNGTSKMRKADLTYYKIVREALTGVNASRFFNTPFFCVWRYNLFIYLHANKEHNTLTFLDRLLIKKLLALRFDLSTAAQIIKQL